MTGATVSAGSIWRGSARSVNTTGTVTAAARPVATAVSRRRCSPARIRSRSVLELPGRNTVNSTASGASGISHTIAEPFAALNAQITMNASNGGASGRRCHRTFDASTTASDSGDGQHGGDGAHQVGADRARPLCRQEPPRTLDDRVHDIGRHPPPVDPHDADDGDDDGRDRHGNLHVPAPRQHEEHRRDRRDRADDERALDGVEDASGGERQHRHDHRQNGDPEPDQSHRVHRLAAIGVIPCRFIPTRASIAG